jgi:tetratricopeptide (TPR) repeat protein
MTQRLLRTLLVSLLLGLIAIAYHQAPRNGFHFDDAINIVTHGPVHMTEFSIEAIRKAAQEGAMPKRVLPNVSFAIDWWRGNGAPSPFQITNVIIHAATALAVLALLLQILERSGASPTHGWLAATAATAAWALHPIQVQTVTYIVQRMASLAALFMLLAIIAYVRGRLTRRGHIWYPLALIAAGAAWFSKENAYILPALILLAEFTLCRPAGHSVRTGFDRILLAAPFALLAYIVADLSILHGPLRDYVVTDYAHRDFTLSERLLTQPRVILFHVGQILWPLPDRFSIEHDFIVSTSLWSPWTTAAAIAALFTWIACGTWFALRSRFPVTGFLMLWVPATLAIESSLFALEMVFEHRMYLPSVGLAGLLALACLRLLRAGHDRHATAAALLIVVALLTATLARVPTWRTPITLYEQATLHAPRAPRAWTNLATAYEAENRSTEAIAAYTRALELDPGRSIAYLNRGSSYRRTGRAGDAEADYRRFIALEPEDFRGFYALGALLLANGQHDPAARALQHAQTLDTASPLPALQLARLYLEIGRPDKTVDALDFARTRDPAVADINYFDMLGIANARLGHFDAAVAAFTQLLQLAPAHPQALLNRAYANLRIGRPAAALDDFDQSLARNPNNAHGHYGRAESLKSLGRHAEALAAARASVTIEPDHAGARGLIDELQAQTE